MPIQRTGWNITREIAENNMATLYYISIPMTQHDNHEQTSRGSCSKLCFKVAFASWAQFPVLVLSTPHLYARLKFIR